MGTGILAYYTAKKHSPFSKWLHPTQKFSQNDELSKVARKVTSIEQKTP